VTSLPSLEADQTKADDSWRRTIMKYLISWILLALATTVLATNEADADEALEVLKRVRRVIGGEDIEVGQWPWLVHLKGKIPTDYFLWWPIAYKYYYCGATVLNRRWVMTAAHCFHIPGVKYPAKLKEAKHWHATIGEKNADHSAADRVGGWFARLFGNKNDKIWYIHAEEILWHSDYDSSDNWKHDIALIKLEKDLPIGSDPAIKAVTLPSSNQVNDWPLTGAECVMKGWGCEEAGGKMSDTAKAVMLPVVSEAQCTTYYGDISETRLCAGESDKSLTDKGICPGDSGGPLVCKVGNNWVQAGIASFTSRNNPGDYPGVFTRVSYYLDWIKARI